MFESDPNASSQRNNLLAWVPAIPEHRLIRIIGKGSYGEVWLAQNAVGTYRAIKIVTRSRFSTNKPFEREFSGIQKFEPISRSHSGFVPILQIGIDQDPRYFYYVMELADDLSQTVGINPDLYRPRTLSREVNGKLSISDSLRIGISLGEALQFLHSHGLVHRDVKPSNVLYISGSPRLADIGMVARLDETLSFVGTEGFIPPEGPGTVQADIYSLGKLLYELCTGKDRLEFPCFPEQEGFGEWDAFLEINEVLVKACHNDKQLRYLTAEEMVADLKALSTGKSVIRLRRLERQLAATKRFGVITAVALAAGIAMFIPVYREYGVRRDEREREVGRNIAYGEQELERGRYYSSLPYFFRACELDGAARRKTHLVRLNSILNQIPKITWMAVENSPIFHVAFSQDSAKLLVTTMEDGAVLYTLNHGKEVVRVHHDFLKEASFSPDQHSFLTAGLDMRVRLWDYDGNLQKILTNDAQIFSACFSPSGKLIAVGGNNGKAVLLDRESGIPVLCVEHGGTVQSVRFSPDGNLLITGSEDSTSSVWDVKTGNHVRGPLKHGNWVMGANFSPDGTQLTTASFDSNARVWNLTNGYETIPRLRHTDGVKNSSFSADGRFVLTASYDSSARIWNATDGEPVMPLFPQSGRAMDAQFSSDCRRVATGCWDGSIRVYDLSTVQAGVSRGRVKATEDLAVFVEVRKNAARFEETKSGKLLSEITLPESVACLGLERSSGGIIGLFAGLNDLYRVDVSSGCVTGLKGQDKFSNFATDGKLLAFRSVTNISIFNYEGELIHQMAAQKVDQNVLMFNEKQHTLVSCSDSRMELWHLTNGFEKAWTITRNAPIPWVAFSPDGQWVAVAERDSLLSERDAVIVSATDGHMRCPPLKHRDGVKHISFSPDGTRVVTSSEDFNAFIWDAATGKLMAGPLKHQNQVEFASFSSNGLWVVTASKDRTARVWDALTGEALTPPLLHDQKLKKAAFLDGDTKLATQTESGEVFVWTFEDDDSVLKKLPAFMNLSAGDSLLNWKANWSAIKSFKMTATRTEAISDWHRRQVSACLISSNKIAERFHARYREEKPQ